MQETWKTRVQSWAGEDPLEEVWQPTPVFLPGESHGQRSLVGYSPWGRKESGMTEVIYHAHMLWRLSRDTAKYWLIQKVKFLLKLRIWTRQNAESSRSCHGHAGGCKLSSRKRNGVKWSQNAYLAHSNHLTKPPENKKQSKKKVLCWLEHMRMLS